MPCSRAEWPRRRRRSGRKGFADKFDRAELGPDWLNTGAPYRIENGRLVFEMAHNHPLWLNRTLPRDLQIDFDCTALSPAGDVKVELFGDGRSFESEPDDVRSATRSTRRPDTSSSSAAGTTSSRRWSKQQEHSWQYDKKAYRAAPTCRCRRAGPYHWTITRTRIRRLGAHLDWKLDGQPFIAWDDPHPLDGPGHDHFAFEGWESPIACGDLEDPAAPSAAHEHVHSADC